MSKQPQTFINLSQARFPWCREFPVLGFGCQAWIFAVIFAWLMVEAANGQTPAAASLRTEEWSGLTMGPIEYKVIVAIENGLDVSALPGSTQKVLDDINSTMSTYQPESEVSRFNRNESLEWFDVSLATAQVVKKALEVSEKSGGAFDITVKPLVELWNFGAGKAEARIPGDDEILARLNLVGYQSLEVRLEPPGLRKSKAGLQIDLSAIAKGYAVDQVAELLERNQVDNYFVVIGGEVRCRGQKQRGVDWLVGIESPDVGVQFARRKIHLNNQSIATSGDYRNFFEVDGKRFSHTIQPATGRPVEHQLTSVSVVAADCMTADALATAVMVLGVKPGWELCQTYGAQLLTWEDQGTTLGEWQSAGFPVAVADTPRDTPAPESTVWGTVLGALVVFSIAIVAMAVGVIAGRKPIQGSCGGLSAGNSPGGECGVCRQDSSQCEQPS